MNNRDLGVLSRVEVVVHDKKKSTSDSTIQQKQKLKQKTFKERMREKSPKKRESIELKEEN